MKLVVTKNATKGLMGGVTFEVTARVLLTPDEQRLVDNYKLHNQVVIQKKDVTFWGQPTDKVIDIKLGELIEGEKFACKNFHEVLSYAQNPKSAAQNLSVYLATAKEFGTEEITEFPATERMQR